MYKIKNSKELASLINCINLNNMISEEEMEEYLDKVGELNFNSITISPTYVSLAKEKLADSTTKISTVVGFPLGFETTEGKVAQAFIPKALLKTEQMKLSSNQFKPPKRS